MTEPLFTTIASVLPSLAKTVGQIAASSDSIERNNLFVEFQKATIEYNARIAQEQATVADLVERNRDLEAQVVKSKNWDAEKTRYAMVSVLGGSLVYALKESMKGSEPPHWICANCYQDGQKSILIPRNKDGWTHAGCMKCKAEIPLGHRGPPSPEFAAD